MRAKPEYRNRDETEVVVLDALADRHQEGMTGFEIRSRADVTIDQIEDALAALKADDLIVVEKDDERTLILPDEDVVGPETNDADVSLLDRIRRILPF
ncbi:MarR family transcriptional regulator [Halobacteriales archaeon QH_8_67_36]|nr:MAG: MarR family transcriptional regulator [Halobacteriales archaeon QH_8_67_36]